MFGSIRWRPAFTSIEIVTPGFWARTARPRMSQALSIAAVFSRVRTVSPAHDSCLRVPTHLAAVSRFLAPHALVHERGTTELCKSDDFRQWLRLVRRDHEWRQEMRIESSAGVKGVQSLVDRT